MACSAVVNTWNVTIVEQNESEVEQAMKGRMIWRVALTALGKFWEGRYLLTIDWFDRAFLKVKT